MTTTSTTSRPAGEAFLEARKPRVIVREPEPVWVIDNYRVRTWYYRAAPEVGTKVLYLDDGSYTWITRVSRTRIFLENSCSMRRPYSGARLRAWLLPRLQTIIRSHEKRRFASRDTSGDQFPTIRRQGFARRNSGLNPDRATLYV